MITSFGLFFAGGDGGNRSCASSAASQPSHLYVPFAVAKDGLCGFDYLKKRTQTEKSVQVRLGGDGGNRSCASSAASQPSHLYVPFAVAKDGLCGFDYLKKNEPKPKNRFRFVMVEMAVIETASENPSSMLSTSVGGLLSFPRRRADRQAHRFGIL